MQEFWPHSSWQSWWPKFAHKCSIGLKVDDQGFVIGHSKKPIGAMITVWNEFHLLHYLLIRGHTKMWSGVHTGAQALWHIVAMENIIRVAWLLICFHCSTETAQLLLIVSDGRGMFVEGKDRVMAAVRAAQTANVFIIFVVLDSPNSRVSEEKSNIYIYIYISFFSIEMNCHLD